MKKSESLFFEAFELFKRTLTKDATVKAISISEVFSTDSSNPHSFIIRAQNINSDHLDTAVNNKYKSKNKAVNAVMVALLQHAAEYSKRLSETPPDEQGWMPTPVSYWYELTNDINTFCKNNKIRIKNSNDNTG